MTGDCHVRFYQRLGAKLPRPTNRHFRNPQMMAVGFQAARFPSWCQFLRQMFA